MTAVTEIEEDLVQFIQDPAERLDPHPFYHRLRSCDPWYWSPTTRTWYVTSWNGNLFMGRDRRWSYDVRTSSGYQLSSSGGVARQVIASMFAFNDPPRHTRLRKLVNRGFAKASVEALRPLIAGRVSDVLDYLEERGQVEFLSEVGYPFPMKLTCHLTGFPDSAAEQLHHWTQLQVALYEPDASAEVEAAADVAFQEMTEFVDGYIRDWRRGIRTGGVIDDLAEAENAGQLTRIELVGTVLTLVVGTHETTANQITNGLFLFSEHRDQWERLQEHPELIVPAVEELLRCEAPTRHLMGHWAGERIEIDGRVVEKGAAVVGIIAAANRDPGVVDRPDDFDIGRTDVRHLSFGNGMHMCLGAALARAETQEFFAAFARRFKTFEFVDGVEWHPGWQLRRMTKCPVRVEAR
jgi:cytochrome P450